MALPRTELPAGSPGAASSPSRAPAPFSATATAAHPATRPIDFRGKHAYLIGIGGCGMCGLARMLRSRGANVSGSDMYPSDFTELLVADGVDVGFDQSKAWLPDDTDLVIASAAIKPDHPQLLEAERRGISHLTYAEALGRCMTGMSGIAIAGTHGKSTTTAMLGCAMRDAGLDPTVIVGATCPQLDKAGGFRLGANTIPTGPLSGRPGLLVVEACEFNRSFHHYQPVIVRGCNFFGAAR